jgi:hypothetical protein
VLALVARSLFALLTGMTTLVGARASNHVHVKPLVNFALPPISAGCAGATALGGGAERLPITVSTVAGQVAELVNVCIAGHGPYPFEVDSGAGESIIAASLAPTLHLSHDGSSRKFAGVGCTGEAQPVGVSSWSVAGVPLAPQTLIAATLPDFGIAGRPVGLLGSDVLSRFGSIRIDFSAQTLTLGGLQGPVLSNRAERVRALSGPPPPAVLTQGQEGTTVPLSIVLTPGDISPSVSLRFGHRASKDFIVDTGSSQSVVASSLAQSDGLAHSDLGQRQTTVCSTITVPLVHSGPWSVPGVTLHPQLLGSTSFGSISSGGTAGLLGSDQLKRFDWVVFDYSGGRLVLG